MTPDKAREVLASFGDKHFAENILGYADDPRVIVRAQLAIDAMLTFANIALDDAARVAETEGDKYSGQSDYDAGGFSASRSIEDAILNLKSTPHEGESK